MILHHFLTAKDARPTGTRALRGGRWLLALAGVALLFTGCTNESNMSALPDASGNAAITITCDGFTGSVNGQTLPLTATVKTGAILTITLCSEGSDGGFSWGPPVFDAQALVLLGHTGIPPAGLFAGPGASGSDSWQFRALAPSVSTITIADSRSWEKGVPPIFTAVAAVRVSP